MPNVDLVPVVRPDGRIYRPHKAPRALLVADDRDPYAWIYVQGTHDVDRAYNLAVRLARSQGVAIDRETANRTWIRAAMRDGDPVFDYDPVKGAAAVSFDVVDDWPDGQAH